jgi:hypothetical protein
MSGRSRMADERLRSWNKFRWCLLCLAGESSSTSGVPAWCVPSGSGVPFGLVRLFRFGPKPGGFQWAVSIPAAQEK